MKPITYAVWLCTATGNTWAVKLDANGRIVGHFGPLKKSPPELDTLDYEESPSMLSYMNVGRTGWIES